MKKAAAACGGGEDWVAESCTAAPMWTEVEVEPSPVRLIKTGVSNSNWQWGKD